MSPFSTRFTFKGAAQKTEWALSLTGDVIKLRALVAAKVLSINLLLAMHVSPSYKFKAAFQPDPRHLLSQVSSLKTLWPLDGLLKAEFRGLPGEDKVAKGEYRMIDVKRHGHIIKPEDWTNFFDIPPDLAAAFNGFSVQEEEESVAAMQDDEDLKLYGARSKPAEVIEMDEPRDSLLSRGHKRGLSALGASTLQPASKLFKQDTSGSDSQHFQSDTTNVSCSLMDWNAGPTPLDAWLNQSAIPAPRGSTNIDRHVDEPTNQNYDDAEATDVEIFRRVHIASDTEADIPPPRPSFAAEVGGLELGAQIYFRNITDRYPSLPTYLAIRLAKANQDRSQRLQTKRDYHALIYGTHGSKLDDERRKRHATAAQRFRERRWQREREKLEERIQANDVTNFWTGASRSRGAASVRSGSSSRNSSLRDVPITILDPSEQ
ncbi:MAG: hypothetical protein Q9213_002823 [Squamulea squamosa]